MQKKKTGLRILLFTCLLGGLNVLSGYAQLAERLYYRDPAIDPEETGTLSLEIDNISFFKNNEYAGYFTKGYTLPGFWIQPTVSYQPLKNIRLQAGLYGLRYWGADHYPNYAYHDIAEWKSNHYQKGFHLVPFFRAQIAVLPNLDIVVGSLYGKENHRLIEPLYHPELNLTADPETGAQILYRSNYLKLDTWINWESFIFNNDYHQEAFIAGLSARIEFNDTGSRYHFYMPVQGLAQHRGGEIDTITHQSVQTLMNGAIGAGVHWNTGQSLFKRVELETALAGYSQQAGEMAPFNGGRGFYIRSAAQLGNFRLKASYWQCKNFISLLGSPYYGAISNSEKDMTFDSPQLLYFGAEYSYSFGEGYAIGVDLDIYRNLSFDVHSGNQTLKAEPENSITFGVYFRATPSFLLKKFQ